MKVLIAGATGLIGQEIVTQCHQSNISVNYLTTRKSAIKKEDNFQGFYWNPAANEIDIAAFKGVSVVINLAGAQVSEKWSATYKKEILDSRVNGGKVIFDSLRKINHMVKQYIGSSGISIYPSSFTRLYYETDDAVCESFLGGVVVKWEEITSKFEELGILTAAIRTGIVLDESGGALEKLVKPIRMGVGSPLASGNQWQSWIHIEDIAGIFLHVAKNKLAGVYNGVAPSPVTNKRMTQIIAKHLGKKLWAPKVPLFVLKLILGEMADLVSESQLVSAKKIEETGYRFHYVNLENAVADLL